MRHASFIIGSLAACIALTACGDDLESRNEAAGTDRAPEMTIQSQGNSTNRSRTIGSGDTIRIEKPASEAGGFADGAEAEAAEVVDASPSDLVDSAEGFSTEPLDDTSGFDPSPSSDWGSAD